MKVTFTKQLLFSLLFCVFTISSFAQVETNTAFINRMNFVFGSLEKNRVPTGLLLDYAMEFADLKSYSGLLTDSNKVNAVLLKDMYTTIAMSAIHSNAGGFYSPNYVDSIWRVQRQPGIITLSGLYYNYSKFKDNAASSGLLTVSNDKFYDRYINGVWQNPYQPEKVFAMSSALHAYSGKNLQVKLPSNIWLTNSGSTVSSLAVNFNDGGGYKTITPNQLMNVSYADTGTKTWLFRLTLTTGANLFSHTEIKIKTEPNNNATTSGGVTAARFARPSGPIPLEADNAFNGLRGQGWITVDYANPADATGRFRLVRPLIVVEGFDPGHLLSPEEQFGESTFRTFSQQVEQSGSNLQNLLQTNNQQYDIIYVDWANGTDFLQRNALLLERVIRWVNEEKVLDGSTQPNVVLGQSMGGVISRWALRDMETRGLNHQTRLFISYDAPQQGANVPIAYQHLNRHANSLFVQSAIPVLLGGLNVIRLANNALTLIDAPAARQMLMNRVLNSGQIDNAEHNAWQLELRNMGYPQQLFNGIAIRNVAVSNGSECGAGQGFQPNADLINVNGRANTRFLGDLALGTAAGFVGWSYTSLLTLKPQFLLGIVTGRNDFIFELNCKAQPVNTTTQIYKGKVTYKKTILWLVGINTTITDRTRNADPSVLAIDGTPGGMIDAGINLQNTAFKNWAIKYNISATSIPNFNFIPTTSALDIGRGNTPLTLTNYQARYIGATPPATPFNTPFVNFITAYTQVPISNGVISNNENHIAIAPRNGNWVAQELLLNQPAANCSFICTNNGIAINGPSSICSNPENYVLANAPVGMGNTITWSATPFGVVSIAPSTNGSQATVTRNTSGQVIIQVTINSTNCGSLTVNSTSIRAGGFSSSDYPVSGNSSTCPNSEVYFNTNVLPGATNYAWFWPNDWTYVNGQGTPYLTVRTGYTAGSGVVGVRVANQCDAGGSPGTKYVQVNNCGYYYTISPNPATSTVTVTPKETTTKEVNEEKNITELNIYDQQGNKKANKKFGKVKSAGINVSNLPVGVYFIEIVDGMYKERQPLSILR